MPSALVDPVMHLTDQTMSQGFHAPLTAHLCHNQTITASPSHPGKQQGPVKCLVQGEGWVLSREGCFSPIWVEIPSILIVLPWLVPQSKLMPTEAECLPPGGVPAAVSQLRPCCPWKGRPRSGDPFCTPAWLGIVDTIRKCLGILTFFKIAPTL